jgi:hypothetical protein
VFTARYALSPYIKQIRFVFKRLITHNTNIPTSLCNEPMSYVNAFCLTHPFTTPIEILYSQFCARQTRAPISIRKNKNYNYKRSYSYQIFIKQQNGKFTCHILNEAMISTPSVSIHETVLKSVQY